MKRILIWDLPTRIFHWALALSVIGAVVSVNIGGNAMVWHGRFGLGILGLLVFRLVWGFAGSTYVRFTQFVRGPSAIRAYLRGEWRGEGHNPLGALSVLGLLGVLSLLVATGLFSNDDIAFEGPLYALVGKALSDQLVSIHRLMEPLIFGLIAAHLGAIIYYTHFKKKNLVKPMIQGWKESDEGESAQGGRLIGLAVALVLAVAAVVAASGEWFTPPPPTPPPAASSQPVF
jgi:cytochrome b